MAGRCKKDLSHSTLTGSEDCHEFFCQPCDMDGDHVQAHSFCEQCEEYLCTSCASYHRRMKQMREHVLHELQQMPNKPPLSRDRPTLVCEEHAGKLVEYVCMDHTAVGCQACMTLHHAACTKRFIPEASAGFTSSKEYKLFRANLNNEHAKIDRKSRHLVCMVEIGLEDSNMVHSEARSMVKKQRADIEQRLDKWEEEMYLAIDNSRKTAEDTLTTAADTFKQIAQDYTTMVEQFDELQRGQQDSNLYIAVVKSQNKESLADKLSSAGANICTSRFEFQPNIKLLDLLDNKPNLFGKLNLGVYILNLMKESWDFPTDHCSNSV